MDGNDKEAEEKRDAPASLEILTGPARGTASWLNSTALDVSLNE